jgi:DNA mismatch repair protein MLH1
VYVGVVDENASLLQYKTQLHVVSHKILVREFFYQQVLLNIGALYSIELSAPIQVVDLIRASGCREEDVAPWTNVLTSDSTRRAMLLDYFSVEINDAGCLVSLPDLLPGYFPMRVALPVLMVELATHVDWTEEEQCFVGAARSLGLAFGMLPRCAARNNKKNKKR